MDIVADYFMLISETYQKLVVWIWGIKAGEQAGGGGEQCVCVGGGGALIAVEGWEGNMGKNKTLVLGIARVCNMGKGQTLVLGIARVCNMGKGQTLVLGIARLSASMIAVEIFRTFFESRA